LLQWENWWFRKKIVIFFKLNLSEIIFEVASIIDQWDELLYPPKISLIDGKICADICTTANFQISFTIKIHENSN